MFRTSRIWEKISPSLFALAQPGIEDRRTRFIFCAHPQTSYLHNHMGEDEVEYEYPGSCGEVRPLLTGSSIGLIRKAPRGEL